MKSVNHELMNIAKYYTEEIYKSIHTNQTRTNTKLKTDKHGVADKSFEAHVEDTMQERQSRAEEEKPLHKPKDIW